MKTKKTDDTDVDDDMHDYKDADISLLELKEWKEIEAGAENAIYGARKDIAIAKILLGNAIINIRKLGGETNEETNAKHKAARV